MKRFRKKPVVIEAEQFFAGADVWPEGVVLERSALGQGFTAINTLEGQMAVSEGDWIITGIQGEKYPCKPDIFEMTYEGVEG